MKKAAALLLGTGLSLVSGAAMAQAQWGGTYQPAMPPPRSSSVDNIGEEMQFVFGVDRVMGFSWDRATFTPDGGSDTILKSTNVSLFGSAAGGTSAGALSAPTTNIPRLALDYFVVEGVSIGGSFIFLSSSAEQEDDAGTADIGTRTTWAIHPRVGYAYAFDETFSIWPRLGVTYLSSSFESDATETSFSAFDLTGELMLGISPIENFAFLIGPYLDLGLSGSGESTDLSTNNTLEADTKLTSFGLAVSVLGYY